MAKVMLMNVTHPEESRVGIINNGVLESFEIESLGREHLKGNIYKGVVHRIHPALEAAFVDIGADRDAFLPLDEICFRNLPRNGRPSEGRRRIRDILKNGQELLVQIVKDEFATKPPTLSTFYSLPGRYLVLLPGSDESGISRKIEGDERSRLRQVIQELEPPEGFGVIIRTAAGFDQDYTELRRDLMYLQRLWESVQKSAATKKGVGLIYREHDLVVRSIRDYFTPDIDEIYVDNEDVYQRAREFLRNVMPGREDVLRLYSGDQPIFSRFNVESEIESIYKRRVQLRSGGSIVIDGTEALTAIDVNSGGSVRGSSQEETAYKTNIEAAAEIARQLRLRDLGGLIVIDFIDMRQQSHIHAVERALADAMKPDRARHDIGRISRLGLLEISRQRLRPAATAATYTACPMCEGHGHVRTTESAALVAFRKIHNRVAQGDVGIMRVTLPPEVAIYLLNQKREDLATLESRYGARIQVGTSNTLMPHQIELDVSTARKKTEGPKPGEVFAPTTPAVERPIAKTAEGEGGEAAATPATKKRRRRGRRRGRGRGKAAAAAIAEALGALGAHAGLRVAEPEGPIADAELAEPDEEDVEEAAAGAAASASEASTTPQPASPGPAASRRRRSRRGRGGAGRKTKAPPDKKEQGGARATGANAEAPSRRRSTKASSKSAAPPQSAPETVAAPAATGDSAEPRKKQPRRRTRRPTRRRTAEKKTGAASVAVTPEEEAS